MIFIVTKYIHINIYRDFGYHCNIQTSLIFRPGPKQKRSLTYSKKFKAKLAH